MSLEPALAERPAVPSPPVSKDILAAVAAAHGVTVEAMCTPSRQERLVWARYDAMQRLYAVLRPDGLHKFTMPRIAQMLGGRDHTTVLHGLRRWRATGGVRPVKPSRKLNAPQGHRPLRRCASACLAHIQKRFAEGALSIHSSEIIGPGMLPCYRGRTAVLAALTERSLVIVQDGVIYPALSTIQQMAVAKGDISVRRIAPASKLQDMICGSAVAA